MGRETEPIAEFRQSETERLYENHGEIEITPDALWADSNSLAARNRRAAFEEIRTKNGVIVIKRCADARYLIPQFGALSIPIIGAGSTKDRFAKAYNEPYVKNIVVAAHIPCGGSNLKELHEKNGAPENAVGIHAHAKHHIYDSDPIAQAVNVARETSLTTGKFVTAALHFQEKGSTRWVGTYKDGAPVDNEPQDLQEFFDQCKLFSEVVLERFPNLAQLQSTQNPDFIDISEDMTPAERTFPYLADPLLARRPGAVFRIRIPKPDHENGPLIRREDALVSMRQVEYPVVQFSKAKAMLVSSSTMDRSKDFAARLRERTFMYGWNQKPDTQLFFGVKDNVELKDIDILPKAA